MVRLTTLLTNDARLDIHRNTVDVHRASLMRKLGAPNAAKLARWAFIAEHMTTPKI